LASATSRRDRLATPSSREGTAAGVWDPATMGWSGRSAEATSTPPRPSVHRRGLDS